MAEERAGVPMRACATCARVHFPPREVCPGCGGTRLREVTCHHGAVEHVTWRRPGTDGAHQLAYVRADLGPTLVARAARGELTRGQRVRLARGVDGAAMRLLAYREDPLLPNEGNDS